MKKELKIGLIILIVVCVVIGGIALMNPNKSTTTSQNLYGNSESHWLFGSGDDGKILVYGYDGKDNDRIGTITINPNWDYVEIPIHYKPNTTLKVNVYFGDGDVYGEETEWEENITTDSKGDYLFTLKIPKIANELGGGNVCFMDESEDEKNILQIKFNDNKENGWWEKQYDISRENNHHEFSKDWDNSFKWW